jgi:hypothetical protein
MIDDPTVVAGEVAEGVAQDVSTNDADEEQDAPTVEARASRPATAYEAQRLENECNQLLRAIAGMGAQVNLDAVRASGQSVATIRLLIDKGVVSEIEAQVAILEAQRAVLASVLMDVEQQRLAAQKPQVATVRQPIQIARR